MTGRAGSLTLPEWQDDDEVSSCPICHRQFSFLFRKHHCRRCGKVICNTCSPHRITIPHQYIVRPPGDSYRYRGLDEDEQDEDADLALGGGETVRVCNPCVPDPNYGPPPTDRQFGSRAPFDGPAQYAFPPYDASQDPQRAATFHGPRRSLDRALPDRYRSTRESTSPTRRAQGARAYYTRRANSDAVPAHQVLEARFRRRESRHNSQPDSRQEADSIPPHTERPNFPRGYEDEDFGPNDQQRSGNSWQQLDNRFRASPPQSRYRPIPRPNNPVASTSYPLPPPHRFPGSAPARTNLASPSRPRPTGHRRQQQQAPREPVREEDECPVCGPHDPPFGATGEGDQTARERHIEGCITSHLQFSSPTRSTPAPIAPGTPDEASSVPGTPAAAAAAAPQGSTGTSWIAARLPLLGTSASSSASTPPQRDGVAVGGAGARPRAATAQQRMLVYHATEKDCRDDAGQPQECVICFEEFEVADEMGRLECLCKFHRRCIRGWWESGPPGMVGAGSRGLRWGSCPTHALQG